MNHGKFESIGSIIFCKGRVFAQRCEGATYNGDS